MITLNDLLDLAKKKQGLTSDRQLTEALGKSGSYVSFYRKRGMYPEAETMLKLAELAEVDPDESLILLNMWREKSEVVRDRYVAMLAKIAATVALATSLNGMVSPSSHTLPLNRYALSTQADPGNTVRVSPVHSILCEIKTYYLSVFSHGKAQLSRILQKSRTLFSRLSLRYA